MEDEQLLWKSESISMISSTIGKVMNTLLSTKSKKLEHAIVRLGEPSKSSLSVKLEDSLRFLIKYVRDAVKEEQPLDEVLIPMIENLLRFKDSKHPNQAMILLNWLFQDVSIFLPLAKDLVNIISKREDHYISLGWCRLVRVLVKYEAKMSSYSKSGFRDNYQELLKILSSSIEHLSMMVKNGSVLQDGFELPTRLSIAAADCLLVLTESLTQKTLDSNNLSTKGEHRPNLSKKPISILEDKIVDPKDISCGVSNRIDGRLLLWKNLDQLIVLVQKLQSWSQKSRALHAKGLGQVLQWLKQIGSNWTQVERGSEFEMTGVLLLSSCWKHYSMLSLLEDVEFYKRCDELLEQYLSGIEFYSKDNLEDHVENGDSSIETKKFFLNCLALLLGRLDPKKLENTTSLYRERIFRTIFAQLHCADENVVDMAVSIHKFGILNISGSNLDDHLDKKEFLFPLLGILDENDHLARAVTILIADCCSTFSDDWFVKEVLKRLVSRSISQRRNAIDVISELIQTSSNTKKLASFSFLQEIANQLLNCLKDEDSLIREKAISLLPFIDPSLILPALVRLICETDGTTRSAASNAFVQVLRLNKNFEVIGMLLDILSGISNTSDHQDNSGSIKEDKFKVDVDEVFRLIPDWSKTVEDWNLYIGPLIDKMLSEPSNSVIVRFLSSISELLADVSDLVLEKLLVQARSLDGSIYGSAAKKTFMSDESDNIKNMLFHRLCPLLIIKMLPLRVFNDFNSMTMYGQTLKQCIASGTDNLDITNYECIASLLFNRAFYQCEYEDVTKLAAELCGRIHPNVLFPVMCYLLQRTTESKDVVKMKACLFAICSSLAIRGWDSVSHPDISKIISILEAVLLWPSTNGDEVSKVQHGCIDCLALMICAELHAPKSVRVIQTSGGLNSGCSILSYVIDKITSNEGETSLTSKRVEDSPQKTRISIPFRLCMANVLISTCQKITDPRKKAFAKKILPRLIHSSQVVEVAEVRAACVQVLFSASTHLKLAIAPFGLDLLKVSTSSLQKESQQERMAGARLMTSLMANEDTVIESISGGLMKAKSILLHVSNSDPSPQLRQICQKLLLCLTS